MLKNFVWNYFEKTGNINAFINYNQVIDLENTNQITENRD